MEEAGPPGPVAKGDPQGDAPTGVICLDLVLRGSRRDDSASGYPRAARAARRTAAVSGSGSPARIVATGPAVDGARELAVAWRSMAAAVWSLRPQTAVLGRTLPAPRTQWVRDSGAFANRSRWRPLLLRACAITPTTPDPDPPPAPPGRTGPPASVGSAISHAHRHLTARTTRLRPDQHQPPRRTRRTRPETRIPRWKFLSARDCAHSVEWKVVFSAARWRSPRPPTAASRAVRERPR